MNRQLQTEPALKDTPFLFLSGNPAAEKKVMTGGRPLSKLFTKDQRAFLATHAPDGPGLDDVVALGPITVLKLRFSPAGFGRRLVAELWFYPDGSRILELSTKCAPDEAFQVAAETKAFLFDREIDLTGEQQTKTATALQYFSQLAATHRAQTGDADG